ncbi:hypothetical protein NPN18_25225, partial [Vibrio parahaemolyticus]|nr:hypothetical protein [Vibrio parahaemolyticus]
RGRTHEVVNYKCNGLGESRACFRLNKNINSGATEKSILNCVNAFRATQRNDCRHPTSPQSFLH